MGDIEEVDFDLFDTIKDNEKFARAVVAVSGTWYKKGWREGYKRGLNTVKINTVSTYIMIPAIAGGVFYAGYLVGQAFT